MSKCDMCRDDQEPLFCIDPGITDTMVCDACARYVDWVATPKVYNTDSRVYEPLQGPSDDF